jgi:hypothetical protein
MRQLPDGTWTEARPLEYTPGWKIVLLEMHPWLCRIYWRFEGVTLISNVEALECYALTCFRKIVYRRYVHIKQGKLVRPTRLNRWLVRNHGHPSMKDKV